LLAPEADAAALDTIERSLQMDITEFEQNVAGLTPEVLPSLADQKLSFSAEYKKFISPHLESYLYTIYEDTGGAHPNGYFKSFVFGMTGATVGLGDLFTSTSTNGYLNQISAIASADIENQMHERLGGDPAGSIFADGLAPQADNFQVFVVDGPTLKLFFPPYQVAAYAAGSFEVDIPLSTFGGILKPEYR
jgi:hypothetical protein